MGVEGGGLEKSASASLLYSQVLDYSSIITFKVMIIGDSLNKGGGGGEGRPQNVLIVSKLIFW